MSATFMLDNNFNMTIEGGGGNDRIDVTMRQTPNGMTTVIDSGGGNKFTMTFVPNALYLRGNGGNDTLSFTAFGLYNFSTFVNIDGGVGNDNITIASDKTVYAFGGAGKDTIRALNTIWNPGHTIVGGDGNDNLYGSPGNDNLFGGAGNDLMRGDDGDDYFCGGSGTNSMFGEAGNDNFVVYQRGFFGNNQISNDRINGGNGYDVIYRYGVTERPTMPYDYNARGIDAIYTTTFELSLIGQGKG